MSMRAGKPRATAARETAFVLAVAFVLLLLGAQAAFAAGPATFTQATPAPGTSAGSSPLIMARATDPAGITSGSLTINGIAGKGWVEYPIGHWEDDGCDTWWVVDDYSVANVYVYAGYMTLPAGTNNVTAVVTNTQGLTSTYSWSFTVNQPPAITSVTPTNGSTTSNLTQPISATVSDDGSSFSAIMTLDGAAVLPTFDAATKTYTYTPTTPLTDATNHIVYISVTDTSGQTVMKSWSFRTQAAPLLTAPVPSNGAKVGNRRPPIGLTMSDNTAGTLSVQLSLDGATVYTNAVAQGPWTWTPSSDLALGVHAVQVTVTDSDSRTSTLSWQFEVVPSASFSNMVPAPGSTVGSASQVRLRVDAGGNVSSVSLSIDGVARPTSIDYPIGHWEDDGCDSWWAVDDPTVVDAWCTPQTLTPGAHTVSVTVIDSSATSSYSWSFNIAQPPVFGNVLPAQGSTVTTLTPSISVPVVDDGSSFTATMLLDGAAVTPAFDPTSKTFTYKPMVPLGDWATHTVSFTIVDDSGISVNKTWTFQTYASPKITSPIPAAGSGTTSPRPQIGVTTADSTAGNLRLTASIDGATVFDSSVAQGLWTWTPSADLSAGVHSVRVVATDADGNSTPFTWSFSVSPAATFSAYSPAADAIVGPPSSIRVRVTATSSITGAAITLDGVSKSTSLEFPIGHWEDDGCDTWWVVDDYRVADISCAPGTVTSGIHAVAVTVNTQSSGTSSAAWSFSVDQPPAIATVAPANGSTVDTLTPEITFVATDNEPGLSATMRVDGVSVTPSHDPATNTFRYRPQIPWADWTHHDVSVTVTDARGLSVTRTWGFNVHVAAKLTAPVPSNGSLTRVARPPIGVTIDDNLDGLVQVRLVLDGAEVYSGSAAQGAWSWTPTSDLDAMTHSVRAEVVDANGNRSSLEWSFTSVPPLVMETPSCTGCHITFPTAHPMSNCAACHGSDCGGAGCHGEHGPEYLLTCTNCHSTQHPETDTSTRHMTAITGCEECHTSSLISEHGRYPATSVYKYQCVTCHLSTDPRVRTAIAQNLTSCTACHDVNMLAPHEGIHAGGYSGTTCAGSTCHVADLAVEHAKYPTDQAVKYNCNTCHRNTRPAVVQAIELGNKNCQACHGFAEHESLHVSTTDQSCFGSTCHDSSKSLTKVHQAYVGAGSKYPQFATTCDLCHDNPAVDTSTSNTSCSSCHDPDPHAAVSHTTSVACTESCHAVADLVGVHGRDCSICHPGAPIGGTWNRTCSAAGCHLLRHAELTFDHGYHGTARDGEDCWECHDTATAQWDCHSCHLKADTTAPTSTSNARPSYAGGASITLSATDLGSGASGVARVCYRLDGGPVTSGTSIVIPAPVSEPDQHTLEFWAIDTALNAEQPHVVAFEVWPAETIAPVTTSDAKPSYIGSATIKLTASDAGGSGVAATYYRLDGGAQQTGSQVAVSGSGTHTLEYWSVDHSGNAETPHNSATFTIGTGTGIVYFKWESPPAGSSASIVVWDWNYRVVYQAASPDWNPPGCFAVTVPVNPLPYRLQASWYDAGSEEEGLSTTTALIDFPGDVETFYY